MTNNNPSVAAWVSSLDLAKLRNFRNNVGCILTDGPTEAGNDTALVSLSEFNALQAECDRLEQRFDELTVSFALCAKERMKYQAECENLRQDAEHARARLRELDLTFARFLLGMQSAVIEAEHGKGAEAGMTWIWNGLIGPGLAPDDSETDAQAYFDREIKRIDAAMRDAIARNSH